MTVLAALTLLRRYGWIIAAALFVWWALHEHKAAVQLRADLTAEQQARARDVAALTTLASGLAKASIDTAHDQRALTETIDATKPSPVSPALGALLDRLRGAPGSGNASSGTGAAATR